MAYCLLPIALHLPAPDGNRWGAKACHAMPHHAMACHATAKITAFAKCVIFLGSGRKRVEAMYAIHIYTCTQVCGDIHIPVCYVTRNIIGSRQVVIGSIYILLFCIRLFPYIYRTHKC